MSVAVEQIINESACDFANIVWPIIKEEIGGGELIPVENVSNEYFTKELDTKAGIDAWQLIQAHFIRGLASRIQWGKNAINKKTNKPFNTFTIRYATFRDEGITEYKKRLLAIMNPKNGYLYPALTIHAYLDEMHGDALSIGIIRTVDLFKIMEQGHYGERTNSQDGNIFRFTAWDKILSLNEKIGIWQDGYWIAGWSEDV